MQNYNAYRSQTFTLIDKVPYDYCMCKCIAIDLQYTRAEVRDYAHNSLHYSIQNFL